MNDTHREVCDTVSTDFMAWLTCAGLCMTGFGRWSNALTMSEGICAALFFIICMAAFIWIKAKERTRHDQYTTD
jgi:hypothetical protein